MPSVSNILVELDSTEIVTFNLQHPEMVIPQDSLGVTTTPSQPKDTIFSIINNGNGVLDYEISVAYAQSGQQLDEPWSRLAYYDLTASNS